MKDPRRTLADRDAYYGWVIAAACFLGSTVVFGTTYSFSVFFNALATQFTASSARLALVFGLQTVVLYVGAATLGGLVDRYGPRRALVAGAVLLVGGLVWTSQTTTQLGLFTAYGVVTALGMSLVYLVAFATAPIWFGEHRGLASGIATSGLGVGVLLAAPAANALITATGWRDAYLVFAGIAAVLLAVVVLVFADHPRVLDADTTGEFPDGIPDAEGDDTGLRAGLQTARTPRFLAVFAGWVCVYCTLYLLLTQTVAYTEAMGYGPGVGALAVSVVGASTAVARLAVGYVSDRLGRVRVFVTCSTLMGLASVAFALLGPSGILAAAVLFGAAYGGNGALLSPLTADLFGSENLNSVYGVLSLSFAVSGLLAPYLGARLAPQLGYPAVYVGFGLLGVLGAALIGSSQFLPAETGTGSTRESAET